jgi:signal transduction histidine kinase
VFPAKTARHPSDALALAAGVVAALTLVWRRRFPLGVLAVLCVHAAVVSLTLEYHPVFFVCVALSTVAARSDRRVALMALGAAVVTSGFWVAKEYRDGGMSGAGAVATTTIFVLIVVVAWGIGRTRHKHVRDMELAREEEARRAVAVERVRLGRELHDIVSHSVTVMVLQAAGARRVMATDPDRAQAALASVEEVGTQAMGELRRLLSVLRAADGAYDYSDPALRHGIRDLDALVETMRATGLRVSVEVVGQPGRVDASVDAAAYRVVQEALTNASKHLSSGARADVRLEWREQALVVNVRDDGKAPQTARSPLSTGNGLLGLKERVTIVGGTLSAAAESEGGFRVTATLPVASAPDSVPRGESP